ncbi:MAG: hypothetical protein V4586_13765 [Pseudomonadota bacterium]
MIDTHVELVAASSYVRSGEIKFQCFCSLDRRLWAERVVLVVPDARGGKPAGGTAAWKMQQS